MAAACTDIEHDLLFLLADHPTVPWESIAAALNMTVTQTMRVWERLICRSPEIVPPTLLELHRTSRFRRRRTLPPVACRTA